MGLKMKLIVAVDKNWAIGIKNQLLVRIPADMRFFKSETTGKVVVMGRKTLESFPNKKPLNDRINIVITKDRNYTLEGAKVVHSIEEALEVTKGYSSEDVYVIGGESIYNQLLPYCDTAYVTRIDFAYEADTYFPNLEEMPQWKVADISEEETYYNIEYSHYKYVK